MLITNKNNLLYDTKNFNSYRNIYAILVNKRKLTNIIYNLDHCEDDDLHTKYYVYENKLELYFIWQEFLNFDHVYKIVYGHYYNNRNTFLYQNLHGKNIIQTNVHHCNANELLYNTHKDLICAKTYKDIVKQAAYINLDKAQEWESKFPNPLSIAYINTEEILSITSNGVFTSVFEDECIHITNN